MSYGKAALYCNTILNTGGVPLVTTSVLVKKTDGTTATLYTDATATTTAPNPVNTSAIGNLSFYAFPDAYDLSYSTIAGAQTVRVPVGLNPTDPSPDVFGSGTIRQVAASFTLARSDIALVDCSSGAVTATLPSGPATGDRVTVKKTDSSTNRVTVSGGIIDGDSSLTLGAQGTGAQLVYGGGSWNVVAIVGSYTANTAPVISSLPVTSGLQARYRGASITGVGDGAAVASWPDSSGNGLNLTQATGSKQGLFRASSLINGQPAVQFDGVDDFMSTATSVTANHSDLTYFVVGRLTALSNQARILDRTGPSTSPLMYQRDGAGTIGTLDSNGGSQIKIVTIGAPGVNVNFVAAAVFSGTHTGYLNGTQGTSVANTDTNSQSNPIYLASDGNGTSNGALIIAEVLVYGRALSSTERQQVESYLRGVYATP